MKRFLFFVLIFFVQLSLYGQPSSISKGKIYAVIVGISDYSDDEIKDLDFAHRDAEKFHEYLSSKAGGSVPEDRMRLLTNEKATISDIYTAMSWVQETATKGDMVFFYFSGHGDVESSLYKLGFLLAHDTPHKNYLNNAVRIEDINIMANTLSVTKDVDVVLITDACHSGKLAGSDNRGKSLVGEQLSKVEKNEIRIASCESDQLSQEGDDWGRGRGVFSFYLINGLMGLADDKEEPDGYITLMELKMYLEKTIPKEVFKFRQEDQVPVVKGKPFTMMAITDEDALTALTQPSTPSQGSSDNPGRNNSKNVNRVLLPIDIYFNDLKEVDIKSRIDFTQWQDKTPDEQMDLFIDNFAIPDSNEEWKAMVLGDGHVRKDFQNRMASAIHNNVQSAINAYLVGDREEMERRQYFNAHSNDFDEYEYMLDAAMNLVEPTNYLYKIFKIKKHYFKGVAARLKMPVSQNVDSLKEVSMSEQKKALALEDQAAYIHNEMGILYRLYKQYDKAEYHYNKASELVPNWAIPISNLSGLNTSMGNYEKGFELAQKALKIQPDYSNGFLHLGANAEKMGNLLLAEESYIKARDLNFQHYKAFQNLGFIYTSEFKFDKADENFYEAYLRLKGMSLPFINDMDADGYSDVLDLSNEMWECEVDASKIGPRDGFANFVVGMRHFESDPKLCKEYLLKAIRINNDNPLAHRYLGEMAFRTKNWIEAEMYFNFAIDYHLDYPSLVEYCERESKNQDYLECAVVERFKTFYFRAEENYFFQGETYTNWGYYEKAEAIYKNLVHLEPDNAVAHSELWRFYESRGKFREAELALNNYTVIDTVAGRNETKAFFDRMIEREINVEVFQRSAAVLLYDMIFSKEGRDYDDKGMLSPTFNDKVGFPGFAIMPSTVPGTGKEYILADDIKEPGLSSTSYYEALSAFRDSLDEANINLRLGTLYYYLGDMDKSTAYFQKAHDLDNENAANVLDLVRNQLILNELTTAFAHLSRLQDLDQIDFANLIPLGEMSTYAGEYERAGKSLTSAEELYPFHMTEIDWEKAKLAFFSNNVDEAIDGFQELYDNDKSNADLCYSLARTFAYKGKKRKAFKYLDKALDNGFAYTFVLDQDVLLDDLRSDRKWKELRMRLPVNE